MLSHTQIICSIFFDIKIDASMPNVVRDSGMMWNKNDELEDVKCMIPDRR